MTQRSNQYSKETVVIGFEEHVNEIMERFSHLMNHVAASFLLWEWKASVRHSLQNQSMTIMLPIFILMLGFLYLKSVVLNIFCKT